MTAVEIVGIIIAAIIVVVILISIPDMVRYVHISRM